MPALLANISITCPGLPGTNNLAYWEHSLNVSPGSAKANRREPKTCLGQVFNYKLGCFDDVHILIYVLIMPTSIVENLA